MSTESVSLTQQLLTLLEQAGSQGVSRSKLGISASKPGQARQAVLVELLVSGQVVNQGTEKRPKYLLANRVVTAPPATVRKHKDKNDALEKMRRVLESQRRLGGNAYPVPLRRLLELAELPANFVFANSKQSPVIGAATKNKSTHPDNPLALREDADQLATSAMVLRFTLAIARTPTKHCHSVATLKTNVSSELKKIFQSGANARIKGERLPADIGWISDSTPKLFFIQDLHLPREAQTVSQPVTAQSIPAVQSPAEFAERFTAAFHKLNQESGAHNFVSLVDLRRELAEFSRTEFDLGLRELRVARCFSLSAAEGRHGISAEMREAGIREGDSLLLYVLQR